MTARALLLVRWRLTGPLLLISSLLGIELLDELLAGIPVVALPLLRDGLRLSYAQVGLLLTAGSAGRAAGSRARTAPAAQVA